MSTDTLNISNGPWDAGTSIVNAVTGEGENFSDGDIWIFPTDDAGPVAICHKPGDAILIADAGTTFNRTGLSPSQLAKRLEEAERLLREALEELPGTSYDSDEDEIGCHTCCQTLSYKDHAPSCHVHKIRAFLTPPTNG